uniref:Uncharacterized protein n=1 Tax=Tetranychus urticae TaxID=32264 RepID=T1KKG8_TETUR
MPCESVIWPVDKILEKKHFSTLKGGNRMKS